MLKAWNGDPRIASEVLTAGFADYSVPQAESPEDIARQVSDGYIAARASWIYVQHGVPVAGIFGAIRVDKRARVHSMAVAPEHRRRGKGRQLLAAFLNGMDAAEISAVHLEVIETNTAARSLYEAMGFRPVRELDCFRSVPDQGVTTTLTDTRPKMAVSSLSESAGPARAYEARDVPLHRDFTALTTMSGVVFHRLPSGCWSARRGNVLLAIEDWADDDELQVLLAAISCGEPLKMIDVPEGDRLGPALLRLGWSRYARQVEMIR